MAEIYKNSVLYAGTENQLSQFEERLRALGFNTDGCDELFGTFFQGDTHIMSFRDGTYMYSREAPLSIDAVLSFDAGQIEDALKAASTPASKPAASDLGGCCFWRPAAEGQSGVFKTGNGKRMVISTPITDWHISKYKLIGWLYEY